MGTRSEGHPLAGLLIIGAIFSVALAFYLATPPLPQPLLPATAVHAPLPMHVASIAAEAPTLVGRALPVPVRVEREMLAVAVPNADVAQTEMPAVIAATMPPPAIEIPATPALNAFSWSTVPSSYPAPVSHVSTLTAARGTGASAPAAAGGAVTHAFATAGSAVRSAFKKAFE